MIENFFAYTDLLAILLGLAISGLIIFGLYLFGAHGEHDGDVDTDGHIDGLDHDFDHGFDHGFDHDFDHGDIASSIDVDGGSSLLAQIGAFCLTVGLFGFFAVLSLGEPEEAATGITTLDVAVIVLLAMGIGMYLISNRILRALTRGAINPIQEVQSGLRVTVVSDYIDFGKQGRVVVHLEGGEKIMMAKGHDVADFLLRGETGYIAELGIPLKISQLSNQDSRKSKIETESETRRDIDMLR
ncbi:MAG: hypothetical protein ACFFD4_05740 [Candidatus Odinarchaeota archaeon]